MATERERQRSRERLGRLSRSSLDPESIQREAIAELRRVIGFDRWCWPLADPDTLIPLGGVAEHDYGPGVARALELEYSGDDLATKQALARRANSAACLSGETGGDLARSSRWDEVLRHVGIGDLAAVACRDAIGCWGWIEAYRDGDDRRFEAEDVELLASVGPGLASALRRGQAAEPAGAGAGPQAPGVIVDPELQVVSWTAGARAWIDALPLSWLFAQWGALPAVVYPPAALARRAAEGAHALERAVDGRWVMIEAERLHGRGEGDIAITLRAATRRETFDRLCRIYALTPRERDVVAAISAGLDTRAISERMFISRHTIQDHLKSVFAKVGVHSRRALLARFGTAEDRA